jgi:hypothetical protein
VKPLPSSHVGILVTPTPVPVLPCVATGIARTKHDRTVKYWLTFTLCELFVPALAPFVPASSTWIPRPFA